MLSIVRKWITYWEVMLIKRQRISCRDVMPQMNMTFFNLCTYIENYRYQVNTYRWNMWTMQANRNQWFHTTYRYGSEWVLFKSWFSIIGIITVWYNILPVELIHGPYHNSPLLFTYRVFHDSSVPDIIPTKVPVKTK